MGAELKQLFANEHKNKNDFLYCFSVWNIGSIVWDAISRGMQFT
jgi:hypothetical protein